MSSVNENTCAEQGRSIPDGWLETTLGEVINIIGGGTPKTKIPEYWDGEIPWLSVVDFNNDNRWVSTTEKSITELGLKKSSTKLLNVGDIIISARGTVGAMAQLKREMAFNQSCYGIKEVEDVSDKDFLFYLTKHSLKQINRNTYGAVFDTITTKTFDVINVNLPSLPEQKAIANILTAFDDKIENLQAQNKTLEQTAQTIFKEWFGKYQVGDELPDGWRVGKITELFEIRDGTHDSPKQKEIGYKLITSKHLGNNRIKLEDAYLISEEDYINVNKRSRVEQFDILVSMIGTIGLIYLEQNELINYAIKNVALFKTSQNKSFSIYTYLWLKSSFGKYFFETSKSGTTQEYISLKSFRAIELVIPDDKMINRFNNIVFDLFGKIKNNTAQTQTLKQTRDTLLPKLMSGQIRVNAFKA
ncbi:restriction endonuclease subunit S [Mesoflavibacter sp. CH_XMU1404-2]|uniref:restriction endonuclease subunit S n=1 Tax=Mesoflavibacter sp. CH_XMU1404-2 TaxID=3107766 RepID=UPI0030090CF9